MRIDDRVRIEAEMVAAGFAEDDAPKAPRCEQCGGYAHICELPDSTCRFKAAAREWCENDERSLARLLRKTEDASWERLSVARTKEPEKGSSHEGLGIGRGDP